MKRIALGTLLVVVASSFQITEGNELAEAGGIVAGRTSPFVRPGPSPVDARQIAGVGHWGGVAPVDCPEDTFRTSVGHCQPHFDFD